MNVIKAYTLIDFIFTTRMWDFAEPRYAKKTCLNVSNEKENSTGF